MGGEALGPVKVLCQSKGEHLGQEAGEGGLVKGGGGEAQWDRGFLERKLGKWLTFEM